MPGYVSAHTHILDLNFSQFGGSVRNDEAFWSAALAILVVVCQILFVKSFAPGVGKVYRPRARRGSDFVRQPGVNHERHVSLVRVYK